MARLLCAAAMVARFFTGRRGDLPRLGRFSGGAAADQMAAPSKAGARLVGERAGGEGEPTTTHLWLGVAR